MLRRFSGRQAHLSTSAMRKALWLPTTAVVHEETGGESFLAVSPQVASDPLRHSAANAGAPTATIMLMDNAHHQNNGDQQQQQQAPTTPASPTAPVALTAEHLCGLSPTPTGTRADERLRQLLKVPHLRQLIESDMPFSLRRTLATATAGERKLLALDYLADAQEERVAAAKRRLAKAKRAQASVARLVARLRQKEERRLLQQKAAVIASVKRAKEEAEAGKKKTTSDDTAATSAAVGSKSKRSAAVAAATSPTLAARRAKALGLTSKAQIPARTKPAAAAAPTKAQASKPKKRGGGRSGSRAVRRKESVIRRTFF